MDHTMSNRGERIRFGSVFTRKNSQIKKKRLETEPELAQTGQFRSNFSPVFYPKTGQTYRLILGFLIGFLMGFVMGF